MASMAASQGFENQRKCLLGNSWGRAKRWFSLLILSILLLNKQVYASGFIGGRPYTVDGRTYYPTQVSTFDMLPNWAQNSLKTVAKPFVWAGQAVDYVGDAAQQPGIRLTFGYVRSWDALKYTVKKMTGPDTVQLMPSAMVLSLPVAATRTVGIGVGATANTVTRLESAVVALTKVETATGTLARVEGASIASLENRMMALAREVQLHGPPALDIPNAGTISASECTGQGSVRSFYKLSQGTQNGVKELTGFQEALGAKTYEGLGPTAAHTYEDSLKHLLAQKTEFLGEKLVAHAVVDGERGFVTPVLKLVDDGAMFTHQNGVQGFQGMFEEILGLQKGGMRGFDLHPGNIALNPRTGLPLFYDPIAGTTNLVSRSSAESFLNQMARNIQLGISAEEQAAILAAFPKD